MTVAEKILAAHAGKKNVSPGEFVNLRIDARVARDFGGANVVKHMRENHLPLEDAGRTFFTFDCNPAGSDQKYAANQHLCRLYAREQGIRVFDIQAGIGTHVLIEEGLAYPGSTAVSTDSHANILGAVGAFGQGMGDKDIAAAWSKGSVWFKVPPTARIILDGRLPEGLSAKDIVLNLLEIFGPSTFLGYAIEVEGDLVEELTMDQRITIASMATEMGAIILLFPPNRTVIRYCESRARRKLEAVKADRDARYGLEKRVDVGKFSSRISLPGNPHHTSGVPESRVWIDSAFIGSCTNGRIEDLKAAAEILQNRRVAEGVVLKVVPATDRVWQQCLDEGLLEVFKDSGALVSNAGCAGCAVGQVGLNGPGEVTISTGNRNFRGKQGQGEVYLASPQVVAASAVTGYITLPGHIPDKPANRRFPKPAGGGRKKREKKSSRDRPVEVRGRAWYIPGNNIDTDMIYHNRHLAVTDQKEMGKYAFGNLEGFEDFPEKVLEGDIIVTGSNFGAGSSRQQAVDCFISLGISCILAESFGAIYERNAINAALPVMVCDRLEELELEDRDDLSVNFRTGIVKNLSNDRSVKATPFSEVQMELYQNYGLL